MPDILVHHRVYVKRMRGGVCNKWQPRSECRVGSLSTTREESYTLGNGENYFLYLSC